jgi:hypothetical protein
MRDKAKNYTPLVPNGIATEADGGVDWENATQLKCPYCGFPYVHFEKPSIKVTDDYDAWDGRGSAITVPMWCENGHEFTMGIGFHKGFSYVFFEQKPSEGEAEA